MPPRSFGVVSERDLPFDRGSMKLRMRHFEATVNANLYYFGLGLLHVEQIWSLTTLVRSAQNSFHLSSFGVFPVASAHR